VKKLAPTIEARKKFLLKPKQLKAPAAKIAQREYKARSEMSHLEKLVDREAQREMPYREQLQAIAHESKIILRRVKKSQNKELRVATQKTTGKIIAHYGITNPFFKKIIHERAQILISEKETQKLYNAFLVALTGEQRKAMCATGDVIYAATINSLKLRTLTTQMLR
jgi:hypothetical protein